MPTPTTAVPAPGVVRQIVLHNTQGTSDKLYRIRIVEKPGGVFDVEVGNCRRGQAYVHQPSKANGVGKWAADQTAERTRDEKMKGGYRVIEDSTFTSGPAPASKPKPAAVNPNSPFAAMPGASGAPVPVPAPAGISMASPVEVQVSRAMDFLVDPAWVMHTLKGGDRLLVGVANGQPFGINERGDSVALPRKVVEALQSFGRPLLIEGELVMDTLYGWDLIESNGTDLRQVGYMERHFELTYLLCGTEQNAIKPVFLEDSDSKGPFLLMAQDEGAEGVIFRFREGEYPGSAPKSEDLPQRFSFQATANFVVLGVAGQSLELGLHPINKGDKYHELPVEWRGLPVDMTLPMGFVEVPEGQPVPEVGKVVEVTYNFASPGGVLDGASLVAVHDEIPESACTIASIRFRK